jgi:HSP20 family protein
MLVRRETAPLFRNLIEEMFKAYNTDFELYSSNRSKMPSANIAEDNEKFIIELAIPGFKKDDFELKLENEVLTIKSKEEIKSEEKDENYRLKEFSMCQFSRSFTIPDTIDSEKITATYNDGILYVELVKKEEVEKKSVREIQIS